MFLQKKSLIVVYKDELLMNQLKKLVETRDDTNQSVVGTMDDSISLVSWTEKVWLGNKKAGNISGKILFLGDIKGTDKLIPVIDVKFDDCGVRFGWAGNQAVVFADPKKLITRGDYDGFLNKLSQLPVPEFLKRAEERVPNDSVQELNPEIEKTIFEVDKEATDDVTTAGVEKKHKPLALLSPVKKAVFAGADAIEHIGAQVASKSEEVFRSKRFMKRQMLFYGVVKLYDNGLEEFMNM